MSNGDILEKVRFVIHKRKKLVMILIGILVVYAILMSFPNHLSLAGEYKSVPNECYIRLNIDGTCVYSEKDSTGTGRGKWYLEDGKVYLETTNIGYEVYGEVKYFRKGIYFESNSWHWEPEFFVRR